MKNIKSQIQEIFQTPNRIDQQTCTLLYHHKTTKTKDNENKEVWKKKTNSFKRVINKLMADFLQKEQKPKTMERYF